MLRLVIVCLIAGWASGAAGQQSPPTGGTSPLGIRQQRVERMMEDLERKFKSLKLALQENEPDRAERLQQTLNKAKELLIQKRMSDVTRLLDEAQLDTAGDGQKALLGDIRALLALLLDENTDREKIREQYERLLEWRRQIESLIRAERAEKREAERLANKEQALADLADKIKALENVVRAEREIVAATQTARGDGIQGLGKIATQQQSVREQAEVIANRMAQEAGDANDGAGRPAEPGEKPLGQAIGNQRQAESSLAKGQGKTAQQAAEAAVENLERALVELKNESRRIASLPPEEFDRLARKQDDIAGQTGQLRQQMQQPSPPAEGGQPGSENGGGKPQPGRAQLAKAQNSMQQAAGGLRQQDPSDASRQQGKAIKELEEALSEIEERLNQLREETQVEKLARLEGRFREMLAIQQRLTGQTAALEKKRVNAGGQLSRGDRNAVRAIGDEERRMEAVKSEAESKDAGLAGKAQQALEIIIDDGTSVVFSDVVEQLCDDLVSVGNLLVESLQTDSYVAAQQREIETTLEELIEALQQAQQQKEASGGGGGGGSSAGQEPLLSNSAELKLLRSAQLRINRRTVALDQARPKHAKLAEELKIESRKVAERQLEIAEMTARILERQP